MHVSVAYANQERGHHEAVMHPLTDAGAPLPAGATNASESTAGVMRRQPVPHGRPRTAWQGHAWRDHDAVALRAVKQSVRDMLPDRRECHANQAQKVRR